MDVAVQTLSYVPQIFAAFIVVQVVRYVYSNYSRFQLWRSQGVPGPNPWFSWTFQFTLLFEKNFYKRNNQLVKKYGKIIGVNDLDRMSLIVADPDALKTLLVRDFNHFLGKRQDPNDRKYSRKFLVSRQGTEWKQMRSIMSPTFTSGKMKAMIHLMMDCLKPLTRKIEMNLGQDTDMKALFGAFTMDVIARTAFAVETNTHDDPNHPFVINAQNIFKVSLLRILVFTFIPNFIRNALGIAPGMDSFEYLTDLGVHMLDKRKKDGLQLDRNYHDFLQLMLEAGDEEVSGQANSKSGMKLNQEEIVGNIVLILLAGYETTASTLTTASYALAIHPDIQEKVHKEVIEAKTANDGKLDYDTLMSLPYLDAVIHETLRMYPPILVVERTCSEDYTFNYQGKDIFIPKGSGIFVPIYAVHHMEEYYPEPEVFKPERFLPENKGSQDNYKFLSFVIGPRNCIGMRFALMEAKLALASVIADYKFVPCEKTDIPLDLRGSFFFMNTGRVSLKLEKRVLTVEV